MERLPSLHWQSCTLDELGLARSYALLAAREAVFVVEQRCAYQELDGRDLDAEHLIAWHGDVVAACLRLLPPDAARNGPALGRVLVAPAYRRLGLGRELMIRGLARAGLRYPGLAVHISAQTYLRAFYASLGFEAVSLPYDEDGIAHVDMRRPGC